MALADGSRLTLNTNTLLAVRLGARRRDVYLQRGEAHFEVVHDAARPFFVHAGDTVIRDVGTQFEVRLHADRDVDVLVNEGRVEVQGPPAAAPAGGNSTAPASDGGWVRALSAGEQLVIDGPRLSVLAMSPRQIADELAWRDGALVFSGEPLSRASTRSGATPTCASCWPAPRSRPCASAAASVRMTSRASFRRCRRRCGCA